MAFQIVFSTTYNKGCQSSQSQTWTEQGRTGQERPLGVNCTGRPDLLLPAAAPCPSAVQCVLTSRGPLQPGLTKAFWRHCFPPVSLNSGPAACYSEAHAWEATAGRKERLLYFRGWQLGEKADLCPKTSSPLTISGQKLFKIVCVCVCV